VNDVNDFIAHHGVKGMKWGVIRTDRALGRSKGSGGETPKSSEKDFSKAVGEFYGKKSDKELNANGERKLKIQSNIVHDHVKLNKGVEPSDPKASDLKSGGLTRNQKIALGVGAAAALSVAAYYGHKTLNDTSLFSKEQKPLTKNQALLSKHDDPEARKLTGDKFASEWSTLFGTKVDPDISHAIGFPGNFDQGLKSKASFNRPEFTIPKSMMFTRYSDHAETGTDYGKGTYTTFLDNDKKSYGRSSQFGDKKYALTFQATEDIRVPSVNTVLRELATVRKNLGLDHDDKSVAGSYYGLSGGGWQSPLSKELIVALKSKGYSAIVDEQDAGKLGDLPMVFFGETKQVTAKERTVEDIINDKKAAIPVQKTYA
jgi:hypothetical protein